MAISHICQSCGWDLTHSRAVRDPLYALPLVTCPTCGDVCVRRRHPLVQRFRECCRVAKSVVVLVSQATAAQGLLGLTVTFLVGCAMGWNLGSSKSDPAAFWFSMVLSGACIGVVTGLWLTVGFHHHGFRRAAAGWMIAVMVVLAITATLIGVFGGLADVTGQPFAAPEAMAWVLPALAFYLIPGGVVMLMIMAIATAMHPIGRVILRMHATSRRATWRWMRRRKRLRYSS